MAAGYQAVEAIEVMAWGKNVGALAFDPNQRAYVFEYTPAWLKTGIELAPLHMPLRASPYSFPGLPVTTYRGLPAMIADGLPDSFGNALIDSYLVAKGVGKDAITPLDRLAYLGRRALGALEFKPVRGPRATKSTALHMSELVLAAREAVSGRFEGDRETTAALKNLLQVGTSAGGQRAKAVIAWNPTTNEIRSGHVDTAAGFSHWLVKLDGVKPMAKGGADEPLGEGAGFGRIEYAYYLMAVAAGITMSESRLLEEGGRAHFITKRFDRDGQVRHHVQTLCAMAHLDYMQKATHDYSQLFDTVEQLEIGVEAKAQVFRRMAFNVMARNCDDHTKNHGFLLREGGTWELAPAYDITHSYSPTSEWVSQHLMSVNGKFANIGREDLTTVGDRWNVPGIRQILKDVEQAVAQWPKHAAQAGVPTQTVAKIAKDHVVPL